MEDTRGSGRERVCIAAGRGARAAARARACDRRLRVGASAGSARRRPPAGVGPDVRDPLTFPSPTKSHPPQSHCTPWAARGTSWTWNFQSRGLWAPCAPAHSRRCLGTAPFGQGKWGEERRGPAVPSLPRIEGAAGNREARRAAEGAEAAPVVAAGGAGALESEGPRGGRIGGSGGEGDPQRGREGRSRTARAASEPESWSCRSPATPACALRSAPAVSLRAGPAAVGARGRDRSRKRRSGERGHPSLRGTGTPSGAATRCPGTKAAGQPSVPRSAGGAAPEPPGRQRRRPEPCPRPLSPGGAAGRRRGGAARGAGGGADTL